MERKYLIADPKQIW